MVCGKISVVHKKKLFFNLKVILIISIYKLKRVTVLIMFLRLSNYLLCCTLDVWKLGYLKTYHKIVIKNISFSVNYQTKNSFKIKVDYKICHALLFCLRNGILVYRSSADIFDLNLISAGTCMLHKLFTKDIYLSIYLSTAVITQRSWISAEYLYIENHLVTKGIVGKNILKNFF